MTFGPLNPSGGSGAGRFPGPRPSDVAASLAILDAGTGNTGATQAMLRDRQWPGAELAAPDFGRTGPGRLLLAQATAATMGGTMSDAAPPLRFPSIGGVEVERMAGGTALRVGGIVIAAAALLQAIDSARERAAVREVITRFGLDASQAADVLAARAYVWTSWMAPISFPNLPFAGAANEAAARSVMDYERLHPGTAGLATRGNVAAIAAIDSLIDDATSDAAGDAAPLYRTSSVNPALSTSSAKARSIVANTPMTSWQAHHLIPFATMAGLPVAAQQAIAASGWQMDSAENLIALPANLQSYLGPPNYAVLPQHSGPHPFIYDADVAMALAPLRATAVSMGPPALRAALKAVEDNQRALLYARRYHPRVH